MAFTTFSGPVRSGTVREGAGRNTGLVVLAQSYNSGDLTGDVVGNVDALVFKIPQGSQIVDITVDQTVAATAGTTTVSVGSTSGGAELRLPLRLVVASVARQRLQPRLLGRPLPLLTPRFMSGWLLALQL